MWITQCTWSVKPIHHFKHLGKLCSWNLGLWIHLSLCLVRISNFCFHLASDSISARCRNITLDRWWWAEGLWWGWGQGKGRESRGRGGRLGRGEEGYSEGGSHASRESINTFSSFCFLLLASCSWPLTSCGCKTQGHWSVQGHLSPSVGTGFGQLPASPFPAIYIRLAFCLARLTADCNLTWLFTR